MDALGVVFIFILPGLAHALTIVLFLMLLGTNKRLEILKTELSQMKQSMTSIQVN